MYLIVSLGDFLLCQIDCYMSDCRWCVRFCANNDSYDFQINTTLLAPKFLKIVTRAMSKVLFMTVVDFGIFKCYGESVWWPFIEWHHTENTNILLFFLLMKACFISIYGISIPCSFCTQCLVAPDSNYGHFLGECALKIRDVVGIWLSCTLLLVHLVYLYEVSHYGRPPLHVISVSSMCEESFPNCMLHLSNWCWRFFSPHSEGLFNFSQFLVSCLLTSVLGLKFLFGVICRWLFENLRWGHFCILHLVDYY